MNPIELTPNIIKCMSPALRAELGLQPVAYPSEPGTVTVMLPIIGKPRQTRRDKWAKRPAVVRYRAWCDKLRAAVPAEWRFAAPVVFSWVAYIACPKSYGKSRSEALAGKPHRQKPDRDNCDKALMDALWEHDERVAVGSMAKYWDDGMGERIILTARWEE